jgi:hypothetical protein
MRCLVLAKNVTTAIVAAFVASGVRRICFAGGGGGPCGVGEPLILADFECNVPQRVLRPEICADSESARGDRAGWSTFWRLPPGSTLVTSAVSVDLCLASNACLPPSRRRICVLPAPQSPTKITLMRLSSTSPLSGERGFRKLGRYQQQMRQSPFQIARRHRLVLWSAVRPLLDGSLDGHHRRIRLERRHAAKELALSHDT